MLLKILQNSHENISVLTKNISVGVYFLLKLQLKAQSQHQAVDTLTFFHCTTYNNIQACYTFYPIQCQCCPHIETSQLICTANQLIGFYMRATLAFNGLLSVLLLIAGKSGNYLHSSNILSNVGSHGDGLQKTPQNQRFLDLDRSRPFSILTNCFLEVP